MDIWDILGFIKALAYDKVEDGDAFFSYFNRLPKYLKDVYYGKSCFGKIQKKDDRKRTINYLL